MKQTERTFKSTEKSEDIKLDVNDQDSNEIDVPDQIKTSDLFESGKVSNEANPIVSVLINGMISETSTSEFNKI